MRYAIASVLFACASGLLAQEPIFAPDAKLKVEAEGDGGGEGPAWHPKLGVFTSGNNGHIYLLGPDGKSRIYRKNAGTNGLLFDAKGNLLACEQEARRVTRMDADGNVTVLTDNYDGKRYNTPNDLTVDGKGRIYFSDPRYGKRDGMEILDSHGKTIEGVYRIDPSPKTRGEHEGDTHYRPRAGASQWRPGVGRRSLPLRRRQQQRYARRRSQAVAVRSES